MEIKKLWVARDTGGDLYLYPEKPFSSTSPHGRIIYDSYQRSWMIPNEWLLEVTPERGSIEVELKIKDNGN